MRAGGALGEDALPLQLERLTLALPVSLFRVVAYDSLLGHGLVEAFGVLLSVIGLLLGVTGSLLFFDGFALPAFGHTSILTP